jgi:peptidoglycan hydrolase-like protein with peptidoglycan-binding domain
LNIHSWTRTGFIRKSLSVLCALVMLVPASWAAKTKHATAKAGSGSHVSTKKTSSAPRHKGKHTTAKGRKGKKVARGQQAIDGDRAREIQAALIRANYMDGEPTGVFDPKTKAALAKFQGDNGWQTKVLPDSRALIKLGLGPSNSGLLNPESAAVSSPHELGTEKEVPGGSLSHR